MRIGVVGLQGAIEEHLEAVKRAFYASSITGEVFRLSHPDQLKDVDGIIIPGGESTTIGKLMVSTGLFEPIKRMGSSGLPILGTCAGMILLAKRGDEWVERTRQPLLGLMDFSVRRNAFGRQRESFETELHIPALGKEPFRGVFIRAPVAEEVWGRVEVFATFQGKIVGVQQGNLIAVSFHPELVPDPRLHQYFLQLCKR